MLLKLIVFFLLFPSSLMAQNTKPLIATDNSTQTCNTTRMVFSPGSLSCSGSVATVGGGSGNIGIGTTNHFAGYVGVGTIGPFQTVEVNGNVGIGTGTPLDYLNVYTPNSGGITISSQAMSNGIDSFTKLMLHLDNNVTDSEISPKIVTNNSMGFSSSTYKFGGFAGSFDGASSFLSLAASSDWNFNNNNFTIDFWVNFNTVSTSQTIFSNGSNSAVYINELGLSSSNMWNLNIVNNSITNGNFSWTFLPTAGVWYHMALVKSGSSLLVFINGVSQTVTVNTAFTGNPIGNPTQIWQIGASTFTSLPRYLNGFMDEFRISNGIARWTSNFNPPTMPYSGAIGIPQLTFSLPSSSMQTGFINTNGSNSNYLQIGQGENPSITIDNNENVGIGSASPGVDLDVTGTIRATNFIGNGSGLTGILPNASAGQFYGATSANTPGVVPDLTFNSSSGDLSTTSNVGIGTPSISGQALSVNGNIGTQSLNIGTSAVLVGTTGTGTLIVTNASPTIASPTLSGTTTMTTATAVTVRGGTGNGSIITIEGTSAAAPTSASGISFNYGVNSNFQDLRQQQMTGNIGIGSYQNNNVMGNPFNVVGGVGIGTGSSSQFINASAPNGGLIVEGNVGIGTTVFDSFDNPTLAVVNYASSPATIIIQSPTNGTANLDFTSSGSSNPNPTGRISQIRTNSPSNGNTDLAFYTNNSGGAGFTEKMRISAMGNVGIGSVAPGQILDVKGTIRISNLGSTLSIIGGTNGCHGVNALTTGAVTISTTCTPSVAQNIVVWDAGGGTLANIGSLSVGTVTGGTSFVCNSSNTLDSSNCGWFILGNS